MSKVMIHLITPFTVLQVLWRQFLKFKETELPAKEADKNRSKHIFKSFEVSSSNKSTHGQSLETAVRRRI